MKQQYVYPAVLYYDEENNNYAVAFNDLDIFTEGDSVEGAFKSAKDYLIAYLECSNHINNELENPTSYVVVKINIKLILCFWWMVKLMMKTQRVNSYLKIWIWICLMKVFKTLSFFIFN